MKKIWLSLLSITIIVSLYSCKKRLDVNTNPNDPADVAIKDLLPTAQLTIAQQQGNYFAIVGGIWGQYWTQSANSSQYRSFEQYNPGPTTANRAWEELYAGALTDLNKIIEKAGTAENTKNYTAIAKILQGYTYQILTDNFGDIPFSEALRGERTGSASSGVQNPKYDKQQDVYAGIINIVKEGRDLIDPAALSPGNDDLILHGDMVTWYQFANTLLLRMYLRMSYVNPSAAMQGIAELGADPTNFLSQDVALAYTSTPGNTNPLYSEIVGLSFTQNLIASATAVDHLQERGDPRVEVFYTIPVGLEQGYYSTPTPTTYGEPQGILTGGDASDPSSAEAPVKFISANESFFLQAEASARTGDLINAQTMYEAGISNSFAELDLSDYIPDGNTITYVDSLIGFIAPFSGATELESRVKLIVTEKWYALNGTQNLEAWTEWRRTGYPDFFVISRNTRKGQNFPVRLPYPESELTRNLNFPGQKDVVSDKVWWDVH
jgi:hypothetical protein